MFEIPKEFLNMHQKAAATPKIVRQARDFIAGQEKALGDAKKGREQAKKYLTMAEERTKQ